MLTRVTITGADSSVSPSDLLALSREFPFVEWGILFSTKHQNIPRYPSLRWKMEISLLTLQNPELKLSAHFCGALARETLDGANPYARGVFKDGYQRLQLNGFSDCKGVRCTPLIRSLKGLGFILQANSADALIKARTIAKMTDNTSVLYDVSGGHGIRPEKWPTMTNLKMGYAGGIDLGNIVEVCSELSGICTEDYWIDMESSVRSYDDKQFDLRKVRQILEMTKGIVG